jgi:hypothetical protein
MKKAALIVMSVIGVTAAAAAQDPSRSQSERAEALKRNLEELERAKIGVESRITPGAPYSAEAVTESIQVLADGNRIIKKNTTRIFRDSEGRTRREQMNSNGADVDSINISDPVAGATYVLNPQTKTAFHNGVVIATPSGTAVATVSPRARGGTITSTRGPDGSVTISASEALTDEQKREREMQAATVSAGAGGRGRGGAGGAVAGTVFPAGVPRLEAGQTKREELGQQTIEGVVATGTRSTTTIPAGAIGNEQPIQIVSEQWFSPDLKVLVLTKHSDPRVGETTYRLTNVIRNEQPRSMFEVPSDYTIRESFIRREDR